MVSLKQSCVDAARETPFAVVVMMPALAAASLIVEQIAHDSDARTELVDLVCTVFNGCCRSLTHMQVILCSG
jgi:hypothetical protein